MGAYGNHTGADRNIRPPILIINLTEKRKVCEAP